MNDYKNQEEGDNLLKINSLLIANGDCIFFAPSAKCSQKAPPAGSLSLFLVNLIHLCKRYGQGMEPVDDMGSEIDWEGSKVASETFEKEKKIERLR